MRGRITKYDCHTKIEAPAIQQGAGAFTITIEGMDERSKKLGYSNLLENHSIKGGEAMRFDRQNQNNRNSVH